MEPTFKWIPVSKLQGLEDNPRFITENDFKTLAESISKDKNFFIQRPCLVNLVNGEYIVYAGQQRLKAAKSLKWKEVPCWVEENIPKEIMDERVLKDNIHQGQWDKEALANKWQEVMEKVKFPDIDFKGASQYFAKLREEQEMRKDLEKEVKEKKKESKEEDEGENGYSIQTKIVFNTEQEQDLWNQFVRSLKKKYSDVETTSERIVIFLNENKSLWQK